MPTTDRQERIAKAYVKEMASGDLLSDLLQGTAHNLIYRKAVLNEVIQRFVRQARTLEGIDGALDTYRQALKNRQHGGVAGGACLDAIEAIMGRD